MAVEVDDDLGVLLIFSSRKDVERRSPKHTLCWSAIDATRVDCGGNTLLYFALKVAGQETWFMCKTIAETNLWVDRLQARKEGTARQPASIVHLQTSGRELISGVSRCATDLILQWGWSCVALMIIRSCITLESERATCCSPSGLQPACRTRTLSSHANE